MEPIREEYDVMWRRKMITDHEPAARAEIQREPNEGDCPTSADGSISSESSGDEGAPEGNRHTPVADIWTSDEVAASLHRLPDAEEIQGLLDQGLCDEILEHRCSSITAPLVTSWQGRCNILKKLLERGANSNLADDCGRSCLHLAAYIGSEDCVAVLLQYGANINQWDSFKRATPLHCAASAKSLPCIKLLLAHGADLNAGLSERSPLHYAVLSDAPLCVQELLRHGACPDTPQVFTETPLHVAAAIGSVECEKLLLEYGADVRSQFGPFKITALHLAAEDRHAECARLLLDEGAHINCRNSKLQTPLHLASLAQSPETLELMLKRGADPNARDVDGRTPLHGAIVKVSRSCECVRLLLSAGANVNQADNFGYTPIHIAALNEVSTCVSLLLDHGGDVTVKTNGGVSALSFIVRRTPDAIPRYINKFNNAIKLNDHEIGDVDCEFKLDFKILVPSLDRGETGLLLSFIEVGRKDILKHPLCETFLFLKWRKIRKFFIIGLVYHTVLVLLFSVYVIGVFVHDCRHMNDHVNENCGVSMYIIITGYLLIIFNLFLLAKEIFQACHSWTFYIKQWDNWLQWFIIIGIFLCVVPGYESNVKKNMASWQHHIAAVAIFLTWLELMMIVGRFPTFGLYVQMFTTVAVNFSKFLMAYSCLLVAFGLSFVVLFSNYPPFQNVLNGLIKTVMMMSGELEYEDIFYNAADESPIQYPATAQALFLAFVLLVTVILTNLLVGLAVSDIQALQESAGLDRLVRQAELVAHLESMLFSPLLHCIPKSALAFCHKSGLLISSPYRSALCIQPNNPRENRIPKDLISSVYKLVAERKDERRSFRRDKYNLKISENKRADSKKKVNINSYSYYRKYNDEIEKKRVSFNRNHMGETFSTDNSLRPTSCFSAFQDFSRKSEDTQPLNIEQKVAAWIENTENNINVNEDKLGTKGIISKQV